MTQAAAPKGGCFWLIELAGGAARQVRIVQIGSKNFRIPADFVTSGDGNVVMVLGLA